MAPNITLFFTHQRSVEFINATVSFHSVKKKWFSSLYYFVDLQYKKAVMAVFTSHVACSHPANCECEKHTVKYVHGITYFPYATMRQANIWDIFEPLFRYPTDKFNVAFWWREERLFLSNAIKCRYRAVWYWMVCLCVHLYILWEHMVQIHLFLFQTFSIKPAIE